MTSRVSWCCGGCGTWNAPHQDVCGTCCGTAATTANHRSKSPQHQLAGKKAVASKTSTTKSRYEYTNPAFQEFWKVYPLRRGKAAAYRKFIAAVAAGVEAHRIIEAAAAYAADPSRDPAFTKWPEGWLAAGRWDDEPTPTSHPLAAVAEIDFEAEQEARRAEEDAAIAAAFAEDA